LLHELVEEVGVAVESLLFFSVFLPANRFLKSTIGPLLYGDSQ
jgi:hypothetical protein